MMMEFPFRKWLPLRRFRIAGLANLGQPLEVEAEQGDDVGHVFGSADPPAHPSRLRQYVVRARPAGCDQFVADARRKRQVSQPVPVEMPDLAVVDRELYAAETVGVGLDPRPARHLFDDCARNGAHLRPSIRTNYTTYTTYAIYTIEPPTRQREEIV